MSIDRTLFFCLKCNNFAFSEKEIAHQHCAIPIKLAEIMVNFKLKHTRWRRFVDKFLSIQWSHFLAFTGAIIINVILLPHFQLSFKESLLESFCLGLVLTRLLK